MSSPDTTLRPSSHCPPQSRRLLHIEASGSEVAIDYRLVRRIGSFAEMTRLADGSEILERVAVFDGSIIPVIDIRSSTDASTTQPDIGFPDFLVIAMPDQLVGVRVDRVIEILLVPAQDIQSINAGEATDFITGVVWLRTRKLPLVNMRQLLKPADRSATTDGLHFATDHSSSNAHCLAPAACREVYSTLSPNVEGEKRPPLDRYRHAGSGKLLAERK